MLEHGGGVRLAAQETGSALTQWLDLSTGINPYGWSVPVLPNEVWQRLPEQSDDLLNAAWAYYGTKHLLPIAGSQAAIQLIPGLRATGRVALVAPTYAEHAAAWQRAGHQILTLTPDAIEKNIDSLDVLLLVHPNNPTGQCYPLERLRDWRQRLAQRGGWLVLDEAFMDTTPQSSLVADCGEEGLLVLRSIGKFFGLAGIRLGFVAAWPELLTILEERLGPWAVNHPARWVGALALADRPWQIAQRQTLISASQRLAALLIAAGLPPAGGTALFQWVPTPEAQAWYAALKQQAVLVRLFQEPAALRFGLPGRKETWLKLEKALVTIQALRKL